MAHEIGIGHGWKNVFPGSDFGSSGPVFKKTVKFGNYKIEVRANRLGASGDATGPNGLFRLGDGGTFDHYNDRDNWDPDSEDLDTDIPVPPKSVEKKLRDLIYEGFRVSSRIKAEVELFKESSGDANYSMNPTRRRKNKYRVRKNYKKYSKRIRSNKHKSSKRRVGRKGKH